MIEHVVIFKLKDSATREQRDLMAQNINAMRDRIPGVTYLTCGPNVTDRGKGFGVGLIVRLTDRAALDVYRDHPVHTGTVETYVKPILDDLIVIDYEA